MSIIIQTSNLRGQKAPLYRVYPRQLRPQPAYVEMDEDGNVSADYSGEIGNGAPSCVWHKRTLRWSVPAEVNGDSLADYLEDAETIALLERVHAGHSVEWDGNNHVGQLDEDATAAAAVLERDLGQHANDLTLMEIWPAADWISAGFRLAELVEHASVEACAALYEEGTDATVVIDGSIAAAIAERAAELVRRHISSEINGDETVRRAAEILREYDAAEYGDLVQDYANEFAGD